MKNYFSYFPEIQYKISKTETKKAVDILRRVGLSETLINNDRNVQSIFVTDGQTPEKIAELAYGSPKYYWVVLLSAKIHNPFYEWPLEYQQLRDRIAKDYPGVSLFVSSVNDGMNTKSESVNFKVGDTIEVVSASGEVIFQYSGTIYDYDLTSGHMKIKDIIGDNVTDSYSTDSDFIVRSTTDSTKTGFLRRKIQDVSFSLSKFKDTVTGREYSPLYRFSGNSTLIQKYTDTNTSLDANGQLSSGAEILNQGIRVVTVEESEEELNDRNRYVKILRPELLGQLTSELKFTLRD
tara:strand:- start:4107 stop:4985 length:879 start_codon:yes stop_codon:yes gene_type:complete